MIYLARKLVGYEQADRRENTEDNAELDPRHLIVAQRYCNGDQANAAGNADCITDGRAPGAHFALFLRAACLIGHHRVVGHCDRGVNNSRGKDRSDQSINVAEAAHGARYGEQQNTGQKHRDDHAQEPWTGFAGFGVGLVHDLAHEQVRNRVKNFGDQQHGANRARCHAELCGIEIRELPGKLVDGVQTELSERVGQVIYRTQMLLLAVFIQPEFFRHDESSS